MLPANLKCGPQPSIYTRPAERGSHYSHPSSLTPLLTGAARECCPTPRSEETSEASPPVKRVERACSSPPSNTNMLPPVLISIDKLGICSTASKRECSLQIIMSVVGLSDTPIWPSIRRPYRVARPTSLGQVSVSGCVWRCGVFGVMVGELGR